MTIELVNTVKTEKHKDYDEEKQKIGQKCVDAECTHNQGIVGREVPQVVGNARLQVAEVLRLGYLLEVEEFLDGTESRELALQ